LQQRHRRQTAPLLFEYDAQIEQAHAGAAVLFGQSQPDQGRITELAPQRAVDPLAVAREAAQSLVVGACREDLGRQLAQRVLLFGERACETDRSFDAVYVAIYVMRAFLAVLLEYSSLSQTHFDLLEWPLLSSRVECYSHRNARAQCGEQQRIGIRSRIFAARADGFICD
jgi:hypothetical protein